MSTSPTPRLNLSSIAPDGYASMRAFAQTVETSARKAGIEPEILLLVQMRASQVNGCAYCLDMHSAAARRLGETEQRLYVLDAWREAPFFTERERAALALTEAVTSLHEGHVPDEVFEAARAAFSDDEVGNLIMAATVINAWNRIAVSARLMPSRRG
ncbi:MULTISPECIES: carboxymuconolactone decarboxylase family protein [unclassified Micromonospora]|uniref:carboxymuconolactone decarboxylase family protein n=1 Tax=unclassified Micromonospora TaxID=2617518 RepID=UPI0033A7E78F